ncbi:hypothetical protein IGB31_09365 [Pseudomonas putida]|nr:hypothetical protein IGB31_09365 [Pseudomonas putida]
MKSLCITGSIQSTLDQFAEVLLKAGVTPAVAALRNHKISITQWHKDALASLPAPFSLAPVELDRRWDHLALDIFYANHNQPLWFWADESSVHFLDYWLAFDQNIDFVLVHTSPQVHLITALNEGKETLLELETALEEWCRRTQAMLHFYLKNPTRSIFVDNNLAASQPNSWLKAMTEHWQLPLQATEARRTKNDRYSNMELYIIRNLLDRHPKAAELHNEVQARLIVCAEQMPTLNPVFDQVTAEHIANKLHLLNLQSANHKLEQQLKIKENEIQELDIEKQKILSDFSQLKENSDKEKIAFQTRLDNLMSSYKQKEDGSTKAVKNALAENDMLLHQLHRTQEVVESNFAKIMHKSEQLEALQGRLQALLNKFPDHWELDSIEIKPIKTKTKTKTKVLQWRLSNVYLAELNLPEIRFQTQLTNGVAGIVFQRSLNSNVVWPTALQDNEELACIATRDSSCQGNNEAISKFGTSDWRYINILVTKLIQLLGNTSFVEFPASFDKGSLKAGLSTLASNLMKWPLMLRYDDIQLSESIQSDEYKCIDIKFKNLSLGDFNAPEFNYRLATVDESATSFGKHPRIEFPEISRNTFQNWFAESNDERGARLELRFLEPNAMDTQVWNLLADKDRILIAGLVSSLPRQLGKLQKNNPNMSVPWQDWHALSHTVKKILLTHVTKTHNEVINKI